MKEPLISVIIPVYNRADRVTRAVRSVLDQTEGDLELIVVDDGSDDGVQAALAAVADPRLRLTRQDHGGACRARNLGVSLARGRYVAFHDSDDLWRRDKLGVQLKCLRETGADVVFSQIAQRAADGSVSLFPSRLRQGFAGPDDSLLGAATQTLLGVREAFLSCPFDPDMPRLQEFEMLCRLRRRYSIYFLERPLVDYAPGSDSISADPAKLTRAIRLLREKHPALFSGSSAVRAELGDQEAAFQAALEKRRLYRPYIRLREAAKRQRDENTLLWNAAVFPVRAARKLARTFSEARRAEPVRCFERKKAVFGKRLARKWAAASAADILTGGHTHFYHRSVRRFLDGEVREAVQAVRTLPEPALEKGPLPVWTLWWDGEESAPPCVKLALQSQKKYFSGPEFAYRVLDKENYAAYARIDQAVLARWQKGEMSLTHLSDVLRCELLRRHGGLWIDATVYMTGPLDRESLDRDFYTVHKTTYPENLLTMIPAGRWACYLMRCRPGDPLMTFLTAAYGAYWRKYADVPDYYLLDELIDAAYRLVPDIRRMIDGVPVNNERIFDLYTMRNEAYTPKKVEPVLRANRLHKLSYKDQYLDCCPDGRATVWKWLLEEARREV